MSVGSGIAVDATATALGDAVYGGFRSGGIGVLCPLVPAKAGTQGSRRRTRSKRPLDSRLRGNERMRILSPLVPAKAGTHMWTAPELQELVQRADRIVAIICPVC